MEKKILLTVAYDGTNFSGWQRQKENIFRTVQGELEVACKNLFQQETPCTGASRTDSGVHALGQRAAIVVNTTIPTERVPYALNAFLPKDIVITAAEEVEEGFHPRFGAKEKTYEYKIYNARYRNPIYRNYSEFIYEKLDILNMQRGAEPFIGTHDFKGFCATGSNNRTTVRTIYDISVFQKDEFIILHVRGSGFLYNMIRIIAGTLIYVGLGKIPYKDIPDIISSCDRTKAGKTAGPQGLTLVKINYD